ncbi:Uncharacterized protein FKW44_007267 [Caligus rogercresseyi]|uniref:Uncharacterized protein n=1 Tax=Caligus rogercresseyi TaxID=217165 RepID=A0A7T8KEH5_CALRO|nr:Uncharacterized protein FKW44_007267 [Caligus rogercresseyi]
MSKGSISRWTCVGSDTAASTRTPTINQTGLVNDWRTIHSILDQATEAAHTCTESGFLQVPERVCEAMQVQEGCLKAQPSVCVKGIAHEGSQQDSFTCGSAEWLT